MKVTCNHCGKPLNLVGDFDPSEKVFLAGVARYGWHATSSPEAFVCRDCHHAGVAELEDFVRTVVAAYAELRAEVAQLPAEKQEGGLLSGFAEVEALLNAVSAQTGAAQEIRARVVERLRQLHGEEAMTWLEMTTKHFAGKGRGETS